MSSGNLPFSPVPITPDKNRKPPVLVACEKCIRSYANLPEGVTTGSKLILFSSVKIAVKIAVKIIPHQIPT
jgi:hypothetical protein